VDVKIKLIDNGDDKVTLVVYMGEKKTLEISCSMFLPVFEPCKIMIGGQGSGTYIK
jgi:hypothetical protein